MMQIDKGSFPRPDFIRTDYQSLNGEWEFDFDDKGSLSRAFERGGELRLEKIICVPFPYQSPASGIHDESIHELMWYRRRFYLSAEHSAKTALLHFGAVDHDAEVWLNGSFLGRHSGGYTPFTFNVTRFLREGENELILRVADSSTKEQVRGKQIWNGVPSGCHYVAVSGIWQEVWLEYTSETYITRVKYTVDFDRICAFADITFNRQVEGTLSLSVEKNGVPVCRLEQSVCGESALAAIRFPDISMSDNKEYNWSPDRPNLFDVGVTLSDRNGPCDTVLTYFGLRKIAVHGDRIFLNNSQYYLRTVLDQGYWTEGIYRPADDDGFRRDVELTKELGFNGARKHQKIEDPKYYYWADKLGLLVWGELPSFYSFTDRAAEDAVNTMREFIARDYNHPCIMAWVPFNETWGLRKIIGDPRQSDLARCLYYLCHSADEGRLVSTNDGWENVSPTDFISVHDYRPLTDRLVKYYSDRSFIDNGSARTGHPYRLPGETYGELPILYTEFGGKRIAGDPGWGYDNALESVEAYLADVDKDVSAVLSIPTICGYCYTQLTDCYQETNGLLYMNREPKADPERIAAIFKKKP
ncbi:MAG: glycoside hydrolase family 2 [Clostridia bacterium]|nr:glycoside hydrolase family 2 [Clostridia bacterium]